MKITINFKLVRACKKKLGRNIKITEDLISIPLTIDTSKYKQLQIESITNLQPSLKMPKIEIHQ
jgi:hypothetical protein